MDCGRYLNPDGEPELVKINVENENDCVYATQKHTKLEYREWLDRYLEELIDAGIIKEVTSNRVNINGRIYQSRLVIVKKNNGI